MYLLMNVSSLHGLGSSSSINNQNPSPANMHIGNSSVEIPTSKVTINCVKLTKISQHNHSFTEAFARSPNKQEKFPSHVLTQAISLFTTVQRIKKFVPICNDGLLSKA